MGFMWLQCRKKVDLHRRLRGLKRTLVGSCRTPGAAYDFRNCRSSKNQKAVPGGRCVRVSACSAEPAEPVDRTARDRFDGFTDRRAGRFEAWLLRGGRSGRPSWRCGRTFRWWCGCSRSVADWRRSLLSWGALKRTRSYHRSLPEVVDTSGENQFFGVEMPSTYDEERTTTVNLYVCLTVKRCEFL